MQKIQLIAMALLLLLASATAITIYVSTEAEALQAFIKPLIITKGSCYAITAPEKTGTQQTWATAQWQTTFRMDLYIEGEYKPENIVVITATDNSKTIETQAQIQCDSKANEASAKYASENITVILSNKSHEILNRVYDLATRTWGQRQ